MNLEFSKRVRFLLRQLASKAHEREVRKLLEPLAGSFTEWEAGKLGTWDMVERIHRFVQGPCRRLAKRYDTASILHMNVAYAIVTGLVSESEVPAEVMKALEAPIAFYRQGLNNGSTSPEENGSMSGLENP